MSDLLQRATERVSDLMDEIGSNFKTGVKITVLVRTPGNPNADFCMTSDDLDEVIAMAHRRKGGSPSPQTLLRGKDEAEMMVDEFEKAFFSRCMAETDARRKAYEAARSGLIAALSTEGKDND